VCISQELALRAQFNFRSFARDWEEGASRIARFGLVYIQTVLGFCVQQGVFAHPPRSLLKCAGGAQVRSFGRHRQRQSSPASSRGLHHPRRRGAPQARLRRTRSCRSRTVSAAQDKESRPAPKQEAAGADSHVSPGLHGDPDKETPVALRKSEGGVHEVQPRHARDGCRARRAPLPTWATRAPRSHPAILVSTRRETFSW
jgi:hypothetical protein